jgi:hypothetical protein
MNTLIPARSSLSVLPFGAVLSVFLLTGCGEQTQRNTAPINPSGTSSVGAPVLSQATLFPYLGTWISLSTDAGNNPPERIIALGSQSILLDIPELPRGMYAITSITGDSQVGFIQLTLDHDITILISGMPTTHDLTMKDQSVMMGRAMHLSVMSKNKTELASRSRLWDERSLARVHRSAPENTMTSIAGDLTDRRFLSAIASSPDTWLKSGIKELITARHQGQDYRQLQQAWDDVQIAAREAILRRMTDAMSDNQQLASVDQAMLDLALAQSAGDEWLAAVSSSARESHHSQNSPRAGRP